MFQTRKDTDGYLATTLQPIDVSLLANGLYIIELKTAAGELKRLKFIKH